MSTSVSLPSTPAKGASETNTWKGRHREVLQDATKKFNNFEHSAINLDNSLDHLVLAATILNMIDMRDSARELRQAFRDLSECLHANLEYMLNKDHLASWICTCSGFTACHRDTWSSKNTREEKLDRLGKTINPNSFRRLAKALERLRTSLLEVDRYRRTGALIRTILPAFILEVRRRIATMEFFEGRLQNPMALFMINDSTVPLKALYTELDEALETLINEDVPYLNDNRKQREEGFQNLSTAGTFLAGVTATTLQYNFSPKPNIAFLTNFFWVTSLILSLGCAIQSQVAVYWLRQPRHRTSRVTSKLCAHLIQRAPINLFGCAILALSAGICTWTFAAFTGTAIPPIALSFTIISLGTLIIIAWLVLRVGRPEALDLEAYPLDEKAAEPSSNGTRREGITPALPGFSLQDFSLEEFLPKDITVTAGQNPFNFSEVSDVDPAMDFVAEFVEFSGDGLLFAYCGVRSDIHISQLVWPSGSTQDDRPHWQQYACLSTTAFQIGGLSWGPVPAISKDPHYLLVSWDEDSVTLWKINAKRSHEEVFDFPIEKVIRAVISHNPSSKKVMVWTTSKLLVLDYSEGPPAGPSHVMDLTPFGKRLPSLVLKGNENAFDLVDAMVLHPQSIALVFNAPQKPTTRTSGTYGTTWIPESHFLVISAEKSEVQKHLVFIHPILRIQSSPTSDSVLITFKDGAFPRLIRSSMTMNLDPLSKVDNLFQWVDTFVQKPSLEGHGPIYALLGKMMIFGTEGKLGGQQSEVIVAINDEAAVCIWPREVRDNPIYRSSKHGPPDDTPNVCRVTQIAWHPIHRADGKIALATAGETISIRLFEDKRYEGQKSRLVDPALRPSSSLYPLYGSEKSAIARQSEISIVLQ